MIRLAVSGDEQEWSRIASRLFGTTLIRVDSPQKLVSPMEFDAVLLVEPGQSDLADVKRLLSAGKHVLLTANSWLSGTWLDSLTAEARARGVQLAILNPDHFLPSRKLVRQQLEAGKFGLPGLIRLHRWEPATAADADPASDLPTPLIRDLEFATTFMREMPNLVYATESPVKSRDHSLGRLVHMHLGFAGGGMALIDYSNGLPPGDDYVSFSVIGSAGAAYADDQENMQLVFRGGHPQSLRVEENSLQLSATAQEFVDGLNANRDFSASVAAWTGALKITNAVRESLAMRRAVAFVE